MTTTPDTPAGGAVAWIGAQLADGWRFAYEPDTNYIGANHPQGGKRSVAKIDTWVPDEVVHAIAAMLNAPAGGAVVQGTPEWYVDELRVLASHITGRGVGICNGAAMTIERLRANRPATVPADTVLALVERLKDRVFPDHECPAESAAVWNVALYTLRDELEALTRGEK